MNTNIEKVLAERGSRYGEFEEHAFITQSIKRAMVNSSNWKRLSDDMKEALEMIAHKMGRILNGDPKYIDSWTDIIGYAKLVEDYLIKKERKNNEISIGFPRFSKLRLLSQVVDFVFQFEFRCFLGV